MRNDDFLKVIATQQTQNLVLKGKTIKYNNLVQNGNFANTSDWNTDGTGSLTFSVSNNVATITPTAIHSSFRQTIAGTNGHKYFCHYEVKYTLGETYIENIFNVQVSNVAGTGKFEKVDRILTPTNTNNKFNIYDYDSTIHSAFQLKNVILIDLTLLGLSNISTLTEFYATDLGKFILNGNYLPYSATNTIYNVKTPFTFQTGIRYNNLVPNANRDFTNTITDGISDDRFNFTIFDFTNYVALIGDVLWGASGQKVRFFTPTQTSNNVSFYHSGATENIYFAQNLSVVANHKYAICFDIVAFDSRVVGGIVLRNILLIDLTLLGMESITSVEDFNETDLGQAVRNGLVLPYSLANAEINAITPTSYTRTKRVDLGTLNWGATNSDGVSTLYGVDFIKPITQSSAIVNARSPKYTAVSFSTLNALQTDKCISLFNGTMQIRDTELSGKNATQTRLALTGVILEYETAEPLELNGIGTNYDTFETKSGKVVRATKRVKVKDLTWGYANGAFITQLNDISNLPYADYVSQFIICDKYNVYSVNNLLSGSQNGIAEVNIQVFVKESGASGNVNTFKSTYGETEIVYQLATKTNETERSVLVDHRYTNVVDANGNEIDYTKIN